MKWISVKDRLPEIGETVLVYCPKGWLCKPFIFTASWDGCDWVDEDERYFTTREDSTHWMPLPEPPL